MWALNEAGYRELTANVESSILAQTAVKRGDTERLLALDTKEEALRQEIHGSAAGMNELSMEEKAQRRSQLQQVKEEREGLALLPSIENLPLRQMFTIQLLRSAKAHS